MLCYNQITELISAQFLIISLFEAIFVALALFVFKRRMTARILFFAAVIALVLSLLSVVIVRGNYGGMAYHERFGWPFQFQTVSRNIELGTNISVPFSFRFDFFKFIANTVFWGFIPLIMLLDFFSKDKNKKYRIYAAAASTLFILLTLFFSYSNSSSEIEHNVEKVNQPAATLPYPENSGGDEIVSRKIAAIESEYPDLKDFASQKSFAGQSIKTQSYGDDYYFAYIVHGSGLPIIQATCFRVDRLLRVFMVGQFPDPLDSYIGYSGVDARTCAGIK